MTILNERYTLSNGVEIPKLGLGTWFIDDDRAAQAVRDAVRLGYRNIDTAQAYGNERGVAEGVRTSGVAREELFVSTKLAAEIKDYHGAVAAIDGSLSTLDIGYIDLMLIHSPQPWEDFRGGDAQIIRAGGHEPTGDVEEDEQTAADSQRKKLPLGVPWVEPEDVAPLVVFLASEEARMVSGTSFAATGGDSANITA